MAAKKILNLFFHMDFFEDKKPVTKHLYVLNTLVVGICYESYVRRWFRYLTIMYIIFSVIFVYTCSLITLMQYKTIDISVSLISMTMLMSAPNTLLLIINGYYWRENLHKSFEIINKYSKSYEAYDEEIVPENGNNYTPTYYNKYFKYKYVFSLILLYMFLLFIKPIIVCLTLEASDINPQYDYTYAIPFTTHVDRSTYILIYLLHIVFLIPFIVCSNVSILFLLLFSIIMRNEVVSLRKAIKFESISITKSLDRFCERENNILEAEAFSQNKNRKLSNISKERKLCYERFANHTKKWIFHHQKLFTAMRLLEGNFWVISSINLLWESILCMSFGYISIMALNTKSVEHFLHIVINLPTIFLCCMNGHLYYSMMEELEEEIYTMPWYHLPPTHRKLILNFLSIVQRPCTLKVLKVYPITLSMCPRIIMKIFSFLQLIRVMETKVQN